MSLIKCHECSAQVSTEARTCPSCGAVVRSKRNNFAAIAGGGVVLLAAWFFFGGGLEEQAAKDTQSIYSQVAADAVQQYEITKRAGSPVEICVRAGLVSAAYLQAKDESQFRQWKETERAACKSAGMPAE